MITIIACIDAAGGIGKDGTLPWHLKPDLLRFKLLTRGSTIIMGRKTWESIGGLPRRHSVVITSRNLDNVETYTSLTDAIAQYPSAFVIGGSQLYDEAFSFAHTILITRLHNQYKCDTFFPMHRLKQCKQLDISEWMQYQDIKYRYESYYT